MEKAIGYFELKVDDQVIPLKCGMYAVEQLCEVFDVDTDRIMSLFKSIPNPRKEGDFIPFPKNHIKFMAVAIWAGANCAARLSGGKPYDLMVAYDWIDKLGINSEQVADYSKEFYFSVFTGKVRTEPWPEQEAEKKSED